VERWLKIKGINKMLRKCQNLGLLLPQVKGLLWKWDSIIMDFAALVKVSMRSMMSWGWWWKGWSRMLWSCVWPSHM